MDKQQLMALIKREPQLVVAPGELTSVANDRRVRQAESPKLVVEKEEEEDGDESNRWQEDKAASTNPYQTTISSGNNANNSNNQKNKKLFPQKLWDLINDEKYNFCLRWSDDGQLVYLNRDDFEDSYLKTPENQFHTQKAISFVRQMNMYGFRKVDDCYYENDNFKRDCKYLLKNMIRKHPNKINNNNNNNLLQQQQSPRNDHATTTEIRPYLYSNNSTATAATAAASTLLQSSAAAAAAASILTPSQQHLNHIHRHQSELNQQQLAFMDYRQRLNQYQIYSSNRPQLLNGGNTPDSINVKTNNDAGHLLSQQQKLDEERSSNEDSLSSAGDYCCSAGSSQVGDASIINVLDKIDSADQFSITKQQQQQLQLTDTQYPRDLSKTSTKINQHLNIQQADNSASNLSAFYALISSLNNNNLYHQPSAHMQAHQNLAFDMDRFSSLQHIYQHILATTTAAPVIAHQLDQPPAPITSPTNCVSNNTSVTQSFTSHQQQQSSLVPTTKGMDGSALRNQVSDKNTSSLSTSLIMRNKFSANTAKSGVSMEMFENGYRNGCQFSGRSHEPTKDNKQQQNCDHTLGKPFSNSESPSSKRRNNDNKSSMTNRSFKRSVDSILDSNNNNNINHDSPEYKSPSDAAKRMKAGIVDQEEFVDVHSDDVEKQVVSDHAKNLVAQVALARDVRVDSDGILEASRFTQRFVETLFDTAQVIARHSNGSSSSSIDGIVVSTYDSYSPTSGEDNDVRTAMEAEKPRAINLNDLTSALKLLPLKISKLLK